MHVNRRLVACGLALAATFTATPAHAAGPEPVFWQGNIGPTPFYDRQIQQDVDSCTRRDATDLISIVVRTVDAVADTLLGGILARPSGYCYALSATPSAQAGGTVLAELRFCAEDRGDGISQEFAGLADETDLFIRDAETSEIVKSWEEPADWVVTPYYLDAGDCVVYAWHLDLVTDAGTPFVPGHEYVVWAEHPNTFEPTAYFTAP